jgi:hypothetical protein
LVSPWIEATRSAVHYRRVDRFFGETMELQQLILELTQQISDQTAYLRWSHWLAVAVLMFLTTSAGAFFGSYWKKSGEIKAVSDQITTLQNELAANTRIVAEVQTTVSHGDWKKREVSTMRRLKLEELIRSAHECRAWVKDIWMDAWNDTSKAAERESGGERLDARHPLPPRTRRHRQVACPHDEHTSHAGSEPPRGETRTRSGDSCSRRGPPRNWAGL